MAKNKPGVFSIRVPPEFNSRLKAGAKVTGLSKAQLALAAFDAALTAIERHGALVVPVGFRIGFQVAQKPADYVQDAGALVLVAETPTPDQDELARQALLSRARQEAPSSPVTPPARK